MLTPPSRHRSAATVVLAALAPAVWGSTYIIFTETLPTSHAWTVGGLRTVCAGALLLAVRPGAIGSDQIGRVLALAAINIAVFSACLFTAAARLPGGVAATLTSMQPLLVLGLTTALSRQRITALEIGACLLGVVGVGFISLTPQARPDAIGIFAALAAAASMSIGTVLVHRWSDLPSPATLAGWQLTLGGMMLLPVAHVFEGPVALDTPRALLGLTVLVIVGTALPQWAWTRGIRELGPGVAYFTLLSPLVAAVVGAVVLGQVPSVSQLVGGVLVLGTSAFGIARLTPHRSARFHWSGFAVEDRSTRGLAPQSPERFV